MQKSLKSDLFTKITKSIGVELDKINQIIINNSVGKADLIGEISNHLILSGGKRIRPILTILSAKLCGYSGDRHCNLAAAVELIHSATLLHDDVVDSSYLRRGNKTANAIWGNKASILVGDYLLSAAFQLMVADGSLEILNILSKASGIMSDGEVLQLTNSNNVEITEADYLQIISYKTAILFSASTEVGAIVTNSNPEKQAALASFGNNLGVIFQIMDDVLDYNSSQDELGKKIGSDFFEGKITLPVIMTYEKANLNDKAKIRDIFSKVLMSETGQNNQDLLLEMMVLTNKYGGIENAVKKALSLKELAYKNLSVFEENPEKEMLLDILEYSTTRKL